MIYSTQTANYEYHKAPVQPESIRPVQRNLVLVGQGHRAFESNTRSPSCRPACPSPMPKLTGLIYPVSHLRTTFEGMADNPRSRSLTAYKPAARSMPCHFVLPSGEESEDFPALSTPPRHRWPYHDRKGRDHSQ